MKPEAHCAEGDGGPPPHTWVRIVFLDLQRETFDVKSKNKSILADKNVQKPNGVDYPCWKK